MGTAVGRVPDAATVLDRLPGVGPVLADRIRAAYGGEAGFLDACQRLDLDRLLDLEGLSQRRAYELVARVRSDLTPNLAGSARAREVQRRLQDTLAAYANTEHGRRHLRLLPVLRDPAAIAQHQEQVLAMRDRAEAWPRREVAAALARLHRLRDPGRGQSLHRIVLVDSEEDELALRERGVDRWCAVASGRDAWRGAADYLLVIDATGGGGPDGAAPHVVTEDAHGPLWRLVPETETAALDANRATVEAMAELARLVGRESVAAEALEALRSAGAGRDAPSIRQAAEAALARGQRVLADGAATVHLSGQEVLDLLGRGVAPALEAAREEAAAAARRHFKEATGFAADPLEPGLPLRLDESEVARLEVEASARSEAEGFARSQAAAGRIHAVRQRLKQELAEWFRFDVEFALGCWALDHGVSAAATSDRLRFVGGLNVDVARDPSAQRIDYALGGTHPVAVLTGANSGGKTTLLEQMAQFAFLHHWGLPVPAAEAEVPILDSVLVFSASRSADAGAFESFLRDLFAPVVAPGRKLVLLDEVEAMTELEAAGTILGVLLEEVAASDSLGLLVTHLPDQVVRHAKVPLRVDGIDAVGLDERFNLVVDRQPRLNHRARSTPELVVRRVHARSRGQVRDVYARILDRWSSLGTG